MNTPRDIFLEFEQRCFGSFSDDTFDKSDEASVKKVCDILEANKFVVERFPRRCRLDIHASRVQKRDSGRFTEYTAIEVKEAHYRLRPTYKSDGTINAAGIGEMICNGAFVPAQKIAAMGCAASAGYHHQVLAYLFSDFDDVFFIPYRHFDLQSKFHPKHCELLGNAHKLGFEGQQSMRVELVEKWRGIDPLLRHMRQINKNGYCECYGWINAAN